MQLETRKAIEERIAIESNETSEKWNDEARRALFGASSTWISGDIKALQRCAGALARLISEKAERITRGLREVFESHRDAPNEDDGKSLEREFDRILHADLEYAYEILTGIEGYTAEQLDHVRHLAREKWERDRKAAIHHFSLMLVDRRNTLPEIACPVVEEKKTLVVCVHGIRTSGRWMRRLKLILEREVNCVVEPSGYGFLDSFRFLLPGRTRRGPIERVRHKIEHAIDLHPGLDLTIVAP